MSAPAAVRFDRIFLVILDSAGIGGAPDVDAFGDTGSNTLGNIHEAVGLKIPTLANLGLRELVPLGPGEIHGAYGSMVELSSGKDTTSGHWEIAGGRLDQPFPTFPQGFPPEVIEPLSKEMGREILGNRPASGTKIIEELGPAHLETGAAIVYTSGDSVLQIAAHLDIVPIEQLYRWCEAARRICRGRFEVGRVIARPFRGSPGAFQRDQGLRHDLSILPPPGLLPEVLDTAGVRVHAVGKIKDIYAGVGITTAAHTADNAEGIERTIEATDTVEAGLVFTNLVDFDSMFGHRNNPAGYAQALEEADAGIRRLMDRLTPRDLLLLTADHGNDPTTPSTDHSRERVPLLGWTPGAIACPLGERETFADLGQTIAANWSLSVPHGTSFLDALWP